MLRAAAALADFDAACDVLSGRLFWIDVTERFPYV